ncbi:MAG TPA: CopG family transcriptional regulator [Beutenbergiaceae bacterium]|nr:CopG family transcriptional regulator [Beutenbergiaceae bacterium]
MRTTLNLPDALLRAAKEQAAKEGKTLTRLMEEALRTRLSEPEPASIDVSLPTGALGEMLVDITDRDALWEALDERS